MKYLYGVGHLETVDNRYCANCGKITGCQCDCYGNWCEICFPKGWISWKHYKKEKNKE